MGREVSGKGQITVPVAALVAANLKLGDVLRGQVEADGVVRREEDPR